MIQSMRTGQQDVCTSYIPFHRKLKFAIMLRLFALIRASCVWRHRHSLHGRRASTTAFPGSNERTWPCEDVRSSAENAFIASSQHSAPPYFLNMVHRAFLDVCGPSRVISKASPHCSGSPGQTVGTSRQNCQQSMNYQLK